MTEITGQRTIEIVSNSKAKFKELSDRLEKNKKEWNEKYSGDYSAEIRADYNDFNKEYKDIENGLNYINSLMKDIEDIILMKNQRNEIINAHPHDCEDSLMSHGVEFLQLNNKILELSQTILDKNEKLNLFIK